MCWPMCYLCLGHLCYLCLGTEQEPRPTKLEPRPTKLGPHQQRAVVFDLPILGQTRLLDSSS